MKMMNKYEAMWDLPFAIIFVAKHRINFHPSDASPIHTTSYRASLRQRHLEKEKIEQLLKVIVSEPATT